MKEFSLLPVKYSSEFKPIDKHNGELVLNVSSTTNPSFYRTDFKRPTLYIGDGSQSYYTRQVDILAYALVQFFIINGFNKVVFTGPSKGGFGALRLSTLCSRHAPHIQFSNIVFSPQVRLYPIDPNLSFPSYQWLVKQAEIDDNFARDLAAFGSLPQDWPSNVSVTAYCGMRNKLDASQMALLPSIAETIYLPFSGHLSHFPFVVNLSNEEAVRLVVDRAMGQAAAIGDEMSPQARETFIQELLAMADGPQQSITDLVDIEFEKMSDC